MSNTDLNSAYITGNTVKILSSKGHCMKEFNISSMYKPISPIMWNSNNMTLLVQESNGAKRIITMTHSGVQISVKSA
jgi:hypothetical protein